ncbi:MAG: alpha/beta hydrolase [Pseudomonadota bacterium]
MSETKTPPEGEYYDGGPVRLHMQSFGAGPDVVFLHGSGPGNSAWANFSGNYQAFVDAGFKVWMPDLVGFGYSDKPTDKGDYTLDFFCQTLRGALKSAGVEKCSFVGNSLGGGIAIQIALDEPDFVEKLVLMGPGCLEPQADYFSMPGIAKMMAASKDGVTKDSLPDVLKGFVVDEGFVTEELVEMRWAIAETQPREVLSTMKTPALGGRMKELTCPILTFWGADDAFMPPQGQETCLRANEHSKLVLVNHCGHWVMIEHARMFNAVATDFLRHG